MKLKKLIRNLDVNFVRGSKEIEITGICSNSRTIAPGNLFIARKGTQDDGSRYIPAAIAGGAVAVATDIYDPSLKVTQIVDTDMRRLEARLAAEFYGHPSRRLLMVGITGTNGKTTTAYLVKHLLDHLGKQCGLIGTVQTIVGSHSFASTLTTPGVTTCHKLLREMVLEECQAAVVEVSSHALDQERCAEVDFDIGVFTNLSLDHLDYHETMEAYAQAKARLFDSVKWAIVNSDDQWHQMMLKGKTITYGEKGDIRPQQVNYSLEGTSFEVQGVPFRIPLIGHFNVSNALAAIGVGLATGATLTEIASILATTPPVRGRLERIPNTNVFIDFAHTPDGLREVLLCLRPIAQGKLIVLFGCGGDRDATKRPEMGAIATELADRVIVTSDNPRSEDPATICHAIAPSPAPHVEIIVDRQEAIARALDLAEPHDIVLIAGKGHETLQIFSQSSIPFDDRTVVQEARFA